MKAERDSLEQLKAAFENWRGRKKHPREAIPEALLEKARQAARHHGVTAVARAVRVEGGRLKINHENPATKSRAASALAPAFSRVELVSPATTTRPYAELETANGLKVRFFTQTDEVLGLLSSLCSAGGGQ